MIIKSGNANSGSWKNKKPRFAFVPAAEKEINKAATEYGWSVVGEQYDAIGRYAANGYKAINNYLRNGDTDKGATQIGHTTNEQAAAIAKTMLSALKPLPFDVEVWRGVGRHVDAKEFVDNGFVSTSYNRLNAETFSGPLNRTENTGHIIHMVIPKGTPAILWNEREEHELILPPGHKFHIDSSAKTTRNEMDGKENDVEYQARLVTKAGNKNSGSWKNKQPRFPFSPKPEESESHTKDRFADEADKAWLDLSIEQKEAIIRYSGSWYRPINNYLRNGDPNKGTPVHGIYTTEYMQKIVPTLMSAFKPLKQDIDVWRGLRREPSAEFTDKGFVSTTVDRKIAYSMSEFINGAHPLLRMTIPKGTPVIHNNQTDEYEIILPPNTKFKTKKGRVAVYEPDSELPQFIAEFPSKIVKSGNTGKKGGQKGNTNAAKTHIAPPESFTDSDGQDLTKFTLPDDIFHYVSELHEWHDESVQDQRSANPDAYKEGVDRYTEADGIYQEVNKYLRTGSSNGWMTKIKSTIANMNKVLTPIDRTVPVFRAIGKSLPAVGEEFTDKGFVSTSLSNSQAETMANRDSTRNYVVRFKIPKGTKVAFADRFDEREIIIEPGHTFRVIARDDRPEFMRADLVMVK